jgi:hypothetical protein
LDTNSVVTVSRKAELLSEDKEIPVPLDLKPIIPENIDDLIYAPGWWERNYLYVALGLLAFILIAYYLYLQYLQNRRKFLIRQQQLKDPPDKHPLEIPHPRLKLFESDEFYLSTRRLREREVSHIQQLDVPKTIAATVEGGGYPDFQFRSLTKPSEYLVLIDRPSDQNHLSNWAEQLVQELRKQEVFMEIFYYDKDPRICWRYKREQWAYLEDLYFQYYNHRLLIFGKGTYLVNNFTGGLVEWTDVFEHWTDRALISTEPADEWTVKELRLSRVFHVLPATPAGISHLNSHFGTKTQKLGDREHLRAAKQLSYRIEVPMIEIDEYADEDDLEILVDQLQDYLGKDHFQFLCACSVYPELHWDFTIELGKQLETEEHPLLTDVGLYKLSQLPWFQEGEIPEIIRAELARQLSEESKKKVLQTIVGVLKRNPPAEHTYAYNQYQMNLTITQAQLAEDKKEKRKLRKQIGKLAQEDPEVRDYTLLKYGPVMNEMSIQLPDFFKDLFFREGLSILGVYHRLQLGVLGFIALLVALFLILTREVPPVMQIDGQNYQLTDQLDSARFFTYLGDTTRTDSTVARSHYGKALRLYSEIDGSGIRVNYNHGTKEAGWIPANMDSVQYYFNRNIFEYQTGGFEQIQDQLPYSELMDSLYKQSYQNLGIALYNLEVYPEAVRYFSELIDGETAEYHYQLGLAYLYQSVASTDSALLQLETAYDLDAGIFQPDNPLQVRPDVAYPLLLRFGQSDYAPYKTRIQELLARLGITAKDEPLPPAPRPTTPRPKTTPEQLTIKKIPVRRPTTAELRKEYDEVRSISENRRAVRVRNKWGYLDQFGKMVIQPQFDQVLDFESGTASVNIGSYYFFINKSGECIEGDCPPIPSDIQKN